MTAVAAGLAEVLPGQTLMKTFHIVESAKDSRIAFAGYMDCFAKWYSRIVFADAEWVELVAVGKDCSLYSVLLEVDWCIHLLHSIVAAQLVEAVTADTWERSVVVITYIHQYDSETMAVLIAAQTRQGSGMLR